MIKIRDLENAVANLPKNEFAKFREWFHKFDNQKWDKQFEEDVKTGKLDKISESALRDYNDGKCKEL